MKILFFNHTGTISGAEGVLLLILRRTDRKAFEPVLVCPGPSPLMSAVQQLGVRSIGLNELKARFTWRPDLFLGYLNSIRNVMMQFRKIIRTEAPDLIHANSIRAGLVATLATVGLRVKVLWHVHDVLPAHPFSTAIRLVARLPKRNHFIAVSEAAASGLSGTASRSYRIRVKVLHNGIEPEQFVSNCAIGQKLRIDLGFSEDQFIIGNVGQLTERKCQLELVKLFPDILAKNPKAILLIVGSPLFNNDSQYRANIVEAIKEHGLQERVYLLGHRTDMMAMYNLFDVLVLNSRQEPFGTVLLEAMASGTPTVSSDVGGSSEMIDDGVNGFLFPFGESSKLVEQLSRLWNDKDLRSKLGKCGRQTILQRFSADLYIKNLESFYLTFEGLTDPLDCPKPGLQHWSS